MMRWKSERLLVVCLAAVLGLAGCSDLESSGDASAWDDGLNWLDFSGIYADMDSGVLVRDGASGTSSQTAVNEVIATADGTSTSFSGAFANGGVVEGSVLISAGSIGFVDDGAGTLSSPDGYAARATETATANGAIVNSGVVSGVPILPGSVSISINAPGVFVGSVVDDNNDGAEDAGDADGLLENVGGPVSITGTIVHETGAWSLTYDSIPIGTTLTITYQVAHTPTSGSGSIAYSSGGFTINLVGTAPSAGTPIRATYRYTETRSAAASSASTGNPVYTFNVLQTGDRLRIIDSNGNEFQGQLFDVNSSAGDLTAIPVSGDDDNPQVGDFIASFYAEGTANGVFVTLDGSFMGSILGTTQQNTLFDRRVSGSWRESGGKAGVFLGSTDPTTTAATATP